MAEREGMYSYVNREILRRRVGGRAVYPALCLHDTYIAPGGMIRFRILAIILLIGLFLSVSVVVSPLYAQKEDTGKLGPVLHRLLVEYERAGKDRAMKLASRDGLEVKLIKGESLIPVVLEAVRPNGSSGIDLARIEGLGIRVDAVSRSYVRILVPVSKLRILSKLDDISVARVPTRAKPVDIGYGSIISQSVGLTGADALQGIGFAGGGVKVAVVDLGFIGLTDAIAAGELPPGTVRLKGNQTGIDIETGTEHGVGVAEHVMDMAPGAELYCILVDDEVDLQNAADYMRDNGIRVANHSVGWVNASYYDDTGPLTGIINDSHDDDGVFWAVSAGNDALRHWRGAWNDPDEDGLYNFSGSDEGMDLSGSYSTAYIFLNWDQYGNSLTDLDLYIYDKDDVLVASGTGAQTGNQDPQEWAGFSYNTSRAPYRIEIEHYSGPTADLDITIFSFYHNLEYPVPGNALMEPADAHGAFTVGAVYQGDYNLPDPPPEYFSSHGPTNDGRPKPDITAPDGTSSLAYGASYGTSFSSPTTAGAAALMLSVDPLFSPVLLGDTLQAMAIDIGIAGSDSVHGSGKLNFAVSIDSMPSITSVADVPDDQGLSVEIGWTKSFFDYTGSPREITAYDILRLTEAEVWDSVATVPATGAGSYAAIALTLQDSTIAGGVHYSVFTVRARTADPGDYFVSVPDSGYSVDNIVPPEPTGLTVAYNAPGGTNVSWDASGEPDVVLYRIYRDIEMSFDPAPEDLVHETPDSFWVDTVEDGYLYYYRVSAVDDAGNESPRAATETTTGAETQPGAIVLHQNVPNPFNPTTLIRFELPARARVRLHVYDVGGRLVRTLVDGELQQGLQEIPWNGRDDRGVNVASGVYFYRLETPRAVVSRKMVLLR
jgi:hypothetical protein